MKAQIKIDVGMTEYVKPELTGDELDDLIAELAAYRNWKLEKEKYLNDILSYFDNYVKIATPTSVAPYYNKSFVRKNTLGL